MSQDPNPSSGRLLRPSQLEDPSASSMSIRTPRIDPLIGQTIDGRYLVERGIGEGGMGIVYAGQHRVIGKRVAIKVLRREMVGDDEAYARFLQEARSASAIGNPQIVDISDFGRLPDGSTYFVMELLEGRGLGDVMAESPGPMPVARVLSVGKQIARGLAAAHAASIVHRDLKPDNVMLVTRGSERDFVKILDFGIAKVGGTSRMTRQGSVFGTPHYMSPEQAMGAPVDHRTDIYALGAILYEMAAGRVPFDADNMMGILTQHMYKAPAPIRALVPPVDVPPGLDAIVLKCLSKRPEQRYQTMDELVADVERVESGVLPAAVQEMMARSGGFSLPPGYAAPGSMPPLVPATPAGLPRARWPAFVALGGMIALVGAAAVVFAVHRGARSAQAAKAAPVAAAPVAPSAAPVATPAPAPSSAPAAAASVPEQREVIVSVVPPDAVISRDGQDLGTQPVALHLATGESATLTVTRRGYRTKTLTVDGHEPKASVVLDPAFGPAPGAAPVAPPPRSPVDDVGDPFAKKR